MLAIVPILAAVWPAVRAVANQYNEAVSEARTGLDHASERFENTLDRVDRMLTVSNGAEDQAANSQLTSDILLEAKRMSKRANEYAADFGTRTIVSPLLPNTWAVAFFAAFFVVLGRTLFQIYCPARVQEYSPDEYAEDAAANYVASPSVESLNDAVSAIQEWLNPDAYFFKAHNSDHRFDRELVMDEFRAPDYYTARKAERQMTYDSIRNKIVKWFSYYGVSVEIPSSARSLTKERIDSLAKSAETTSPQCLYEIRDNLHTLPKVWNELCFLDSCQILDETPAMAIQRRSTIVKRAATRRYRKDAENGGWACPACALCYATGLLFIVWIIVHQSLAVGEAAGLWGKFMASVTLPVVAAVAGFSVGLTCYVLVMLVFSSPLRKVSEFMSSRFGKTSKAAKIKAVVIAEGILEGVVSFGTEEERAAFQDGLEFISELSGVTATLWTTEDVATSGDAEGLSHQLKAEILDAISDDGGEDGERQTEPAAVGT